MVDQGFSHLGTAGVVGAEEEYALFHGGHYIRIGGYNGTEKLLQLSLLQKSKKLSFRQALSRNPDSNCLKQLDPR
jgi:hypothetical protein